MNVETVLKKCVCDELNSARFHQKSKMRENFITV